MIYADIKTKASIIAPAAAAVMLLLLATGISFENGLSKTEQQVLDFEYRDLTVREEEDALTVDTAEGPLDWGRETSGYETPERSGPAAGTDDIEVSLTIVSGETKMAIIQGVLVKEGDLIDDKKVIRIEPGRVLLKNKINQWVNVTK